MSYSYDAGSTTPTYAGLVEFGGLRINDGTFKSEHLAGLQDGAPVRQGVTLLPVDNGGYPSSAYMNPRDISIDGWLKTASPDDVFAAMDALRAAFAVGDGSLSTLVVKQRGWATRRQLQARATGPVVFVEPDRIHKKVPTRDFTIPMVAPDPLLYDADNLRTIDVPMTGASTAVTNAGTAPVPFVARFTGPWTTQAVLTRASDGAVITYGASQGSSTYVDVTTTPGAISVVDNASANKYNNMGTWSLYLIPPGTTNFTATATGGTTGASKVTLTWRDAWY